MILYRAVGARMCEPSSSLVQWTTMCTMGTYQGTLPLWESRQPFMLSLRQATHPHPSLSPLDCLCVRGGGTLYWSKLLYDVDNSAALASSPIDNCNVILWFGFRAVVCFSKASSSSYFISSSKSAQMHHIYVIVIYISFHINLLPPPLTT